MLYTICYVVSYSLSLSASLFLLSTLWVHDGDRRPCTNVVNLFVNKCSPCLPLHPAHLDAHRGGEWNILPLSTAHTVAKYVILFNLISLFWELFSYCSEKEKLQHFKTVMCNSFPPKLELAIAIHIVLVDSIGHFVLKKEFLNNSAYFDPECSINSRAAWMISRRDSLLTI